MLKKYENPELYLFALVSEEDILTSSPENPEGEESDTTNNGSYYPGGGSTH